MKYRKKPVVIEAIQLKSESESFRHIIDWCKGSKTPAFIDTEIRGCCAENPDGFDYPVLKINTLEGTMTVQIGDWIIKGINGEHYPCKDEIFSATYEQVS